MGAKATSGDAIPPRTTLRIKKPSTSYPHSPPKFEGESDVDNDEEEDGAGTSKDETSSEEENNKIGLMMMTDLNPKMRIGVRKVIQ